MGLVIIFALLLGSGWILVVIFPRLPARRAEIAWWVAFCILVVVGVGIGHPLGFDFEHSVSPNLRVVSFPIAVSFFHFENGHWVDFLSPDWLAYPAAFTNLVVVTAFAVLPLLLASLFRYRKSRGWQEGPAPPYDGDKASGYSLRTDLLASWTPTIRAACR